MSAASLFLGFYSFWHGRLHMPGAGWLLKRVARCLTVLQGVPVPVPPFGTARLDLRDTAAFAWLNYAVDGMLPEEELRTAMADVLRPDAVLWDVGASVGVISAWFGQPQYGLRQICAFEPNASARRTLESLLYGQSHVRMYDCALGAANGRGSLLVDSANSSLGRLHLTLVGDCSCHVDIRTGDDLLAHELNSAPPDVVKIDVEGREADVLAGMARVIAEHHPVIFVEISSNGRVADPPPGYATRGIGRHGQWINPADRHLASHNLAFVPNPR